MAIEDWMGKLQDVLEEVTGIQRVITYADLPGSLLEFPCMVVMPTQGSQEYGASLPATALHQVQVTLYTAAQVLPEAMGTAVPFIKLVRDKVAANVKLKGSVSYCLPGEPFYEGPGALRYGDKEHVGVIFRLVVKEGEVVTVSA